MSAFGNFMIVLTVAYILYYATLITKDLAKKEVTHTMESMDVEGVVSQDKPVKEEVEIEEEVPCQDGGVLTTGGSLDENPDLTRFMPSSEPLSPEADENAERHEEMGRDETPIEKDEPIEMKDEVESEAEEAERVEDSALQEEHIDDEVPAVVPVSSDIDNSSDEDSLEEDDYDPFGYTPSVSPYNVVSVISQPKQRTEADDMADAVNDSLEEASHNSFDDIRDSEVHQLLSDEIVLNDKKITYHHVFESL